MIRGTQAGGYTIVETMIFLLISATLFTTAYSSFSGRQRRAEFNYGVQEFSTRLQDIANDVSTGYYENFGNFRCTASASGPTVRDAPEFASGSNIQGANRGCIFIGRVIQFGANDVPGANFDESYRTFNVVGRRTVQLSPGNNRDVLDLFEASPRTLFQPPIVDTSSADITPGRVRIKWVRYAVTSGAVPSLPVGAVGIFTNFAQPTDASSPNPESTARYTDIIPIVGSSVNSSKASAAAAIDAYDYQALPGKNPGGGVVICLTDGGENFRAMLRLGGNQRQQAVDLIIEPLQCAA